MSHIEVILHAGVVREVWETEANRTKNAVATVRFSRVVEEFYVQGYASDFRRANNLASTTIKHMVAAGEVAWQSEDELRYLTFKERKNLSAVRAANAHSDLEAFVNDMPPSPRPKK